MTTYWPNASLRDGPTAFSQRETTKARLQRTRAHMCNKNGQKSAKTTAITAHAGIAPTQPATAVTAQATLEHGGTRASVKLGSSGPVSTGSWLYLLVAAGVFAAFWRLVGAAFPKDSAIYGPAQLVVPFLGLAAVWLCAVGLIWASKTSSA